MFWFVIFERCKIGNLKMPILAVCYRPKATVKVRLHELDSRFIILIWVKKYSLSGQSMFKISIFLHGF